MYMYGVYCIYPVNVHVHLGTVHVHVWLLVYCIQFNVHGIFHVGGVLYPVNVHGILHFGRVLYPV